MCTALVAAVVSFIGSSTFVSLTCVVSSTLIAPSSHDLGDAADPRPPKRRGPAVRGSKSGVSRSARRSGTTVGDVRGPDGAEGDGLAAARGVPHHAVPGVDAHVVGGAAE